MKTKQVISFVALAVTGSFLFSCQSQQQKATTKETHNAVQVKKWGSYEGQPVYLYELNNGNGSKICISNYGGTITSWLFPDKQGDTSQVIIGFDSLSGYLAHPPYFGALIGRYANRIAKGKFTLDGKQYQLATNDGANHLHGGNIGFDKVLWNVGIPDSTKPELVLNYISKDGEEGYPGELSVTVHYILDKENALKITYDATTTKATPINLTNHAYFNLSGDLSKTILGDILMINADSYTPVIAQIPTGKIVSVKGTPFDFTTATTVGARIGQVPGGYDHNFVLNTNGDIHKVAASVSDTSTGRFLEVYTTEPGIQFYSGNFLDGTLTARGKKINKYAGLTLETQHFPDSPNQKNFPNTILRPGEKFHQEAIYKLSIK
ncbi:aldose epimerase family protein [Arachidicoccus soli]|uniref:Aldose 1-epimerase n=1 Tax=Arachidicoccus soli TaxID=2341117 RepID=A0A386HPD0_9BACT|nr:aldose epimerase family protein [Arachidicoccus soli]AYD47623.1 galactose mutarotase [Arachidicoccus soli]